VSSVASRVGPVPSGLAQPRPLIVTLYGLYAREEDDWLPIAGLVRLMAELGVDGQSVRSSISRLKRRDTLRSQHRDGVAGYALSPAMLEVLRAGDRRIFDPRPARLADGWVQVIFSVPETERGRRHELRSRLAGLGFGPLAPGVWVAPGALADEVHSVLDRAQLGGYVDIFRGEHLGWAPLADRVRQWWDLDDLGARYAGFVAQYRPLARRVTSRAPDPADAFADYVRMLTVWRGLRYRDPGLPVEALPARWAGGQAGTLFTTLNQVLRSRAHRRAMHLLHD
jgi:phenylacetic acid degradation operon negative regulatory protein